jgi:DNA-binding NarL/FixJ family response regulator
MNNVSVLIVDDHQMIRDGLKLMLSDRCGLTTFREAGCYEDAVDVIESGYIPDLVTIDMRMPGIQGVEAFRALREAVPGAKFVVVSESEDRAEILGALSAGAHGYIPKAVSGEEMGRAFSEVLAGRVYAPSALLSQPPTSTIAAPSAKGQETGLTGRQRDVLDELLQGKSTKEIARALDLAEGTVKIHLAVIYRVLGVRSRAEAIARFKK